MGRDFRQKRMIKKHPEEIVPIGKVQYDEIQAFVQNHDAKAMELENAVNTLLEAMADYRHPTGPIPHQRSRCLHIQRR